MISTVNPHDAEIVSLNVDRSTNSAEIHLRHPNGVDSRVKLLGVVSLRCEDFKMLNVVSRLLRSSLGHFSTERIEYWVNWATRLSHAPRRMSE